MPVYGAPKRSMARPTSSRISGLSALTSFGPEDARRSSGRPPRPGAAPPSGSSTTSSWQRSRKVAPSTVCSASLAAAAKPALLVEPAHERARQHGGDPRRGVLVGAAVDDEHGEVVVVLGGEPAEGVLEPGARVAGDDHRHHRRVLGEDLLVGFAVELVVGLVTLPVGGRVRVLVEGERVVLGRHRDRWIRRFERAHQGRQRTVDPFPHGGTERAVPDACPVRSRHDHGAGGRGGGGPLPPRAGAGRRPRRRHRRRQHRRRRLVPRPLRVPRPRLGHLHPRRGPEPRHRVGPRRARRSPPSTPSPATARTPGSASATATSPPTSSAPGSLREGATAERGHRRDHRRVGPRPPPAPDDRRPRRHPHHRDARRGELAMQEWFVREHCEPPVVGVRFEGADAASPRPACSTRIARRRDHARVPEQPGHLDRPDPRGRRRARRARSPAATAWSA